MTRGGRRLRGKSKLSKLVQLPDGCAFLAVLYAIQNHWDRTQERKRLNEGKFSLNIAERALPGFLVKASTSSRIQRISGWLDDGFGPGIETDGRRRLPDC